MSFVGLYTGLTGVRAGQVGIDTSANNIANANTPGYTRQRVELAARPSYDSLVGPLGTGVDVVSVNRLRDAFLDDRARSANADAAAKGSRAELLRTLEDLTGEPDDGVAARLAALWSSTESWANDPADVASRRQVLTDLAAVSETVRSVASQWDTLEADVAVQRDTGLTTVNDALAQLAALDTQLADADPSRVGPELYDQRDLLLDEIAWHTGATARVGADGRSEVQLAGIDLVTADGAGALTLVGGELVATGPTGASAPTTGVLGGELGGLTQVLDVDLPAQRDGLDRFTTAFADAVNAVNTGGVTADGTPGDALLIVDPADPSGSIAAATTDPAALAAATAGAPPAPFDASNARNLADLRLTPVDDGDGGTRRLDAQHADLVTGLAGQVRSARAASDAASSVAGQASTARSAEHGVSLDEEMVSLVRYQRALEAASRVMTTVDEALEVLVNRTGIVGR